MNISTRLVIAVASVLLVTLALLGVVFIQSTRATLIAQLDERIRGEAMQELTRGHRRAGEREDGFRPFERQVAVVAYDQRGRQLALVPSGTADDPDPPPQLPPISSGELDELVGRIVTLPAVDGALRYRVLVERLPGGEIVVAAAPLTAVNRTISRLVGILLVVGAIAMVVATLVSWWLIRRGLRPVDRMVDTAAAIAGGDLSRRVPDADPRTELGRLGGALNEMLHQIERGIQARAAGEARLRRFVADAAHELRTPLTSLRGYAELYRQGALRDETAIANAMRRIESEGARMARLVDDLLLLARLDQQRGLELTPLDLAALVR